MTHRWPGPAVLPSNAGRVGWPTRGSASCPAVIPATATPAGRPQRVPPSLEEGRAKKRSGAAPRCAAAPFPHPVVVGLGPACCACVPWRCCGVCWWRSQAVRRRLAHMAIFCVAVIQTARAGHARKAPTHGFAAHHPTLCQRRERAPCELTSATWSTRMVIVARTCAMLVSLAMLCLLVGDGIGVRGMLNLPACPRLHWLSLPGAFVVGTPPTALGNCVRITIKSVRTSHVGARRYTQALGLPHGYPLVRHTGPKWSAHWHYVRYMSTPATARPGFLTGSRIICTKRKRKLQRARVVYVGTRPRQQARLVVNAPSGRHARQRQRAARVSVPCAEASQRPGWSLRAHRRWRHRSY